MENPPRDTREGAHSLDVIEELDRLHEAGVRVYLTDCADSIGDLTEMAKEAGIVAITPYYGGGYECLPDSEIIRWKGFRNAHIEVTPNKPLSRQRYNAHDGRITNRRRVSKSKSDEPFDFDNYQPTGTEGTVLAWTKPDEEGFYDIVTIKEGDARFRLFWAEDPRDRNDRRVKAEAERKEQERQERFQKAARSAIDQALE